MLVSANFNEFLMLLQRRIRKLETKFSKIGLVGKVDPRTVRAAENIQYVRDSVQESPRIATRRRSAQLNRAKKHRSIYTGYFEQDLRIRAYKI